MKSWFAAVMVMFMGSAQAAEWTPWFVPNSVFVSSGTHYHFRIKGMPAMAACPDSPDWAYVNAADSGAADKTATLREAYLQKKRVRLNVEPFTDGAGRKYCQVIELQIAGSGSANASKVSRNNFVDWIGASSDGSSSSHFVQWKNAIDSACATTSGYRSRIGVNDTALFSLLLAARASNKKVGFYYETATTTGAVPGHQVSCQVVNAWLESD